MFVSFIGSPISGKTTVAAHVFAELKKMGMPVEFLSEQARVYIARLRNKLAEGAKLELTDEDQSKIFNLQLELELLLLQSLGKRGILVSDTTSLNTLFYMSKELREKTILENEAPLISIYGAPDCLLYFCPPLIIAQPNDPNRIHSPSESRKIHDEMVAGLYALKWVTLRRLEGPVEMRANDVLRDVYVELAK